MIALIVKKTLLQKGFCPLGFKLCNFHKNARSRFCRKLFQLDQDERVASATNEAVKTNDERLKMNDVITW